MMDDAERRIIVGTAGHIDHGKTALVRALTGIETDRLEEEQRRGITIDLGFAHLDLPDGTRVGIVDVPGHEGFIRNMLAGATGIDVALLVVAADEGVMPQTREHVSILDLLGVRAGLVAVTKVDLVEQEWLDLVTEELRSELADTPFTAAPIVPVSSITGQGLDRLVEELRRVVDASSTRDRNDLFRLPVDRVFTIHGTGTVVTGTVWTGGLTRDQTVRILPQDRTVRVRALQVHGRDADRVGAGQRAAIALAGVDRENIVRGDVLVLDPGWAAHAMITARIRLLADSPWPLRQRQRIRFHLGTAEVMGRVVLLEGDELAPGDVAWAQLRLESPVVARAGDRFVIRSYSPVTTIGGGVVVEPRAAKRRRLSEEDRALLDALLGGSVEQALDARIRLAGWEGAPIRKLPIELPHSPGAIQEALDRKDGETLIRVGTLAFDRQVFDAARKAMLDAVAAYHKRHPLRPGIDHEELRRALPPRAGAGLADAVLESLLRDQRLAVRQGAIALYGFEPRLTPEQERAQERIWNAIAGGGLTPPATTELAPLAGSQEELRLLLKLLEAEGRIVPLNQEFYMARREIDEVTGVLRAQFKVGEEFTPADLKQVINVSRKYLIPLLEYLDRIGVTARQGNGRVLRSH